MLATMQRVLRSITRRQRAPAQARSIGKLASRRRRQAWVQSVQQLLDSASPSASASQFAHPQWEAPLLVRTTVVEACRPDLLAIKGALVDTRQPISAATLRQLKRFVTEPKRLTAHRPTSRQRLAASLHWTPSTLTQTFGRRRSPA